MRRTTIERYQKIYDLKIIHHYSVTQIQEYFIKEQGVKLKQRVIYKAVEFISQNTVFDNAILRQNAIDSFSYDARLLNANRQVLQDLFNKISSKNNLQENKKIYRLVNLANAIREHTETLSGIKDTIFTLQSYSVEIEEKNNMPNIEIVLYPQNHSKIESALN